MEVIQLLQELPAGKTLLINNAGLGDYGEYISSSPKRNHQMLHVNILAVAELTRSLLPRMVKQGGGIINIASLAADLFIQPVHLIPKKTKMCVKLFWHLIPNSR